MKIIKLGFGVLLKQMLIIWSMNINSGEQSDHMKNSQGGTHGLIPIRSFGNWTMGCMDSLACNYNTEANMADGSCTYAEEGYDCDGNELEFSFQFNGADSFAYLPDMGMAHDSLTIQFKFLNLGIYEEEHVYGGIIGNENWGIDGHFHVQILSEYYSIDSLHYNGKLSVGVENLGQIISQTNFHEEKLNIWSDVAITYAANDKLKLFIDGVLEAELISNQDGLNLNNLKFGDVFNIDERKLQWKNK